MKKWIWELAIPTQDKHMSLHPWKCRVPWSPNTHRLWFPIILQDDESVGGLEVVDKYCHFVPTKPWLSILLVNLDDMATVRHQTIIFKYNNNYILQKNTHNPHHIYILTWIFVNFQMNGLIFEIMVFDYIGRYGAMEVFAM